MVDVIAECEANGTEAEKKLIAACRLGEECILNGGVLPEAGAKDAPTVRAELIRALALEKTSLHERGVWLEGAVVTGQLDMSFAKCRGKLVLDRCRFLDEPQMAQTELLQLSLEGSHMPGLFAQGAIVVGDMFLTNITSIGTVDVASARIGGQLSFEKATLTGVSDQILTGQSLRVLKGFIFREVTVVSGRIDLASAHVGDLVDDAASWSECGGLTLDGFAYDRVSGDTAPNNFAARKDWLKAGSQVGNEFRPQPYT